MKTNNLSKKSFLTTMILALSAGMMAIRNGGNSIGQPGLANGYVGGGSPIYTPTGRRLKGYMRQAHEGRRHSRFGFNKNR